MFAKCEKFDITNINHLEALKKHKFYGKPGTVEYIIYHNNQPERSKREDLQMIITQIANEILREYEDNIISEMRCSEHCGNTVREVQ